MALFGGWRVLWAVLRTVGAVLAGRLGSPFHVWLQRAGADTQAWPALRFMLLAWVACFCFWELHVMRAGDAKTLMGLLALFPNAEFVAFLIVAVFVLVLPVVLLRLRGRRLGDISTAFGKWMKEGQFLPSERRLQEHGRPYVWSYCLPGVVYLWLLW
jgi:Flp pilus assembly protein protease CpaA